MKFLVKETEVSWLMRLLGIKPHDPRTGEKRTVINYTCPNFSWWKLTGSHNAYSVIENY